MRPYTRDDHERDMYGFMRGEFGAEEAHTHTAMPEIQLPLRVVEELRPEGYRVIVCDFKVVGRRFGELYNSVVQASAE